MEKGAASSVSGFEEEDRPTTLTDYRVRNDHASRKWFDFRHVVHHVDVPKSLPTSYLLQDQRRMIHFEVTSSDTPSLILHQYAQLAFSGAEGVRSSHIQFIHDTRAAAPQIAHNINIPMTRHR